MVARSSHTQCAIVEARGTRFRRIEIASSGALPALEQLPEGWLEVERSADFIRAIDSHHSPARFEQLRQGFPPGVQATAKTMTLREIFVVLARVGRAQHRKVAA